MYGLKKKCKLIPHCRHPILHPWFNQGEWLEQPSMYLKIMIALHASICSCITYINLFCITCINSFFAYHKNDLKILTVAMVCSVSKSDH